MTDWVKKALTRRKNSTATGMRKSRASEDDEPSERLVLGTKFAIALTFCFTAIEIANLALLHSWNSEIFAGIMGLSGTITGILISQKAGD